MVETSAKPSYLYPALTAPHSPFQTPGEYINRYAHIGDETLRVYIAMVSVIDDESGRVVSAREEEKMRENTLIVFMSNNGGVRDAMFAGEPEVHGRPADSGPCKGGKGTLYEGGTRVCALVNWPGKVKAGNVDGLVHAVNFYPTLAGLAGAKLEKNKPLDGADVWPATSEGGASPRTEMLYNVDPTAGAIRVGDIKLIWTAGVLHVAAESLRRSGSGLI